jgi:16S rRNA (guanine966-N2)-methyltransferase
VHTIRVTAGTLRGRRVPVPAHNVRPTSERARQAFFNIIGPSIDGARFLDLFAGSGVFSFEAVSRGAAWATAIESDRKAAATIERLASEWNAKVTVVVSDVLPSLPRLGRDPFDVVYADPPYDFERYDQLLAAIDADVALAGDAVVAIEHRRRSEPFNIATKRLQHQRRAEYGEVWIDFFKA